MVIIERITTLHDEFLLIDADEGRKTYQWISDAWEGVDPSEIDGVAISGNACIQGIVYI